MRASPEFDHVNAFLKEDSEDEEEDEDYVPETLPSYILRPDEARPDITPSLAPGQVVINGYITWIYEEATKAYEAKDYEKMSILRKVEHKFHIFNTNTTFT